MTIFEYLSIAASILLALALGRLASSIPYVFSRRRFDPVYAIIFVGVFFAALLQWWLIWGVSEYSNWSFPAFLMLMASPTALFVLAHVLVSEKPSEIDSWSHHLSESHRLIFCTLLVGVLLAYARGFFFLGIVPSGWVVLPWGILLAGAVWNNRVLFSVIGLFVLLRVMAVGLGIGVGT